MELDIETISEIFIRINSKGVPLSSADFAMSKIATYGDRGRNLRKLIDYFCQLAVAPHAYSDIEKNDREFAILRQIARALEISSEELYIRAGILEERDGEPDLVAENRRDPYITEDQKKTLVHIYESFRQKQGPRELGQ